MAVLPLDQPFSSTTGPRNAKIVFVGEAFGEDEDLVKLPFQGKAGQELNRMLSEAGLARRDVLCTNVFNLRPPANNIELFCDKKLEVGGKNYTLPPLSPGKYVRPEYLPQRERLLTELRELKPNLIVALGNTACWAILGQTGIGAIRGAVTESPFGKVLPTYHPAGVLRNWAWRPIVVADLMKAAREQHFPEIRRPERYVLIDPTLEEIFLWYHTHAEQAKALSVDIETKRGQIEMVGFAANEKHSIVIPFIDPRKEGRNYWPTEAEEVVAWDWVQKYLSLPQPKIFQNGLYDLQYLLRDGFRPRNCTEDTMLLAHSLYPEMPKGLGFLGSIHTNEAAWKLMRGKGHDEFKRDE